MSTDPEPVYAQVIPNALLRNARVVSKRADLLPLVPKGKIFVEIGVAFGDFSEEILRECNVEKFIAIDLFFLHHLPRMWDGLVGRVLGELDHLSYYRKRFAKHVDEGRLETLRGDSIECLQKLPDRSADIFYVDANHSYESVKSELAVIKEKITPGGWIMLNDYIIWDHIGHGRYGVIQAANEFMISENWEMIYFALHPGMFCDVVLRKMV